MSQKTNTRGQLRPSLLLAAAAAGLFTGTTLLRAQGLADETPAATAPVERVSSEDALAGALSLNAAFVDLAERVTPAVVRIEVRSEARPTTTRSGPDTRMPEPFRRFFESPDLRGMPDQGPRVGGGTGFIISDDGYIVTNDHVVSGADQIQVWLEDRRAFEAELVGADPTTDVAVIKIDAQDLPTLPWGSSNDVRVGEWVMAVGNPGIGGAGQLDYTVTTGIVSAKGRPLQLLNRSLQEDPEFAGLAGYAIENFIQTDAVINPGNSGGPMVDLYGSVVGINSAIASTSGYYQGYGFAIPADLARKIAEDLIERGTIERGWLGVSVTGVTADDAEVYDLDRVAGVLVQAVTEDSPAHDAGLEQEDVIVAVAGTPVDRAGHLQQLIAQQSPGDRVELEIMRNGRARTLAVELGKAPIGDAPRRVTDTGSLETRLGFQVTDLTERVAERYGFDVAGGVVISNVDPSGSSARRGVAAGFRLLEVDRTPVESAAEARDLIAERDAGQVVSLLLESPDGGTRVVNVRMR